MPADRRLAFEQRSRIPVSTQPLPHQQPSEQSGNRDDCQRHQQRPTVAARNKADKLLLRDNDQHQPIPSCAGDRRDRRDVNLVVNLDTAMPNPLDAEAVIGMGQYVVADFIDPRGRELAVGLGRHCKAARRCNQLAGAVDDHRPAAFADLQRGEKMREGIEGYIDTEQVKTAVSITISGGDRNPRNSLGEKNVNVSPEQLVGSTRAGIPGACAGVVGVCRIVLASDLLARGISMHPSDAAGSRLILDHFDIVAAGFAAANQDEIPVLVGGVKIGNLWHRSKQAGADRLDQRQSIAELAVAQSIAKDAGGARGWSEVPRYFAPDPLLERAK